MQGRSGSFPVNKLKAVTAGVAVLLAACGQQSAPAGKVDDGACGTPSAPTNLSGGPGPGIAQASISWTAADAGGGAPVNRYRVYRDGALFARLGNSLAFGDTG